MKKKILLLFLTWGFTCPIAFAQDTLHVSTDLVPQAILRKLDHEITLSSQQKPMVLEILKDRSKHLEKIKLKEKKITKDLFKVPNEQALAKLKGVLTKEQFSNLLLLRQNDQEQKNKYPENSFYKSDQDIELDF